MRRSDHPSRPNAMTCCFFLRSRHSLDGGYTSRHGQCPGLSSVAAFQFQVTLIGRFWVIPEALLYVNHIPDASIFSKPSE